MRTGIASHFSPGLAALPHFQTMVFFEKVLEPFKNEKVHSMLALVAAKSRSFFGSLLCIIAHRPRSESFDVRYALLEPARVQTLQCKAVLFVTKPVEW